MDIVPPQSYIGALDDAQRSELINLSELKPKYFEAVDGLSAYEMLLDKIDSNPNIESEVPQVDKEIIEEVKNQEVIPETPNEAPQQPQESVLGDIIGGVLAGGTQKGKKKSSQQKMVEKAASQAMNTAAREVTKGIMRGIFGQMK